MSRLLIALYDVGQGQQNVVGGGGNNAEFPMRVAANLEAFTMRQPG